MRGGLASGMLGVILFLLAGCGPTPEAPSVLSSFAAPPRSEGVQLHVGPFDVPRAGEVQKDFYLKLPLDKDVEVKRIEFHFAQGSHHCNLFKSDTEDVADHVEDTFNAIAYEAYDLWAASQDSDGVIAFPAGYTLLLKAHQQLLIQSHYVNGATQKTPKGKGEAMINLWFAKPGESKGHVGMLFGINKTLAIPPHTRDYVATKSITFPADRFPGGTHLFAMTGHFHSRGKRFKVSRYDGNSPGEVIYENTTWSEPPFKTYEAPLPIAPNGKFLVECTFDNDSDATVSFGPRVETQEHANAFMYVFPGPADGRAVYDMDGRPRGGSW